MGERKLVNYILCAAVDLNTLMTEVRGHMEQSGAEPVGGVSGVVLETDEGAQMYIIQAMVVYESLIDLH